MDSTKIIMTTTAIIVDDEPFARDDMSAMLRAHPNIRVVGEAASVEEAKALLVLYHPDLVFLDIQLFGGNGFDLVPYIPLTTDVIFVTSFDQYAVRAFEINALDYLLKPVSEERLASSIARIHNKDDALAQSTGIKSEPRLSDSFQYDDRIFIKTDKEQRFVKLNEISAITSIGGNYTKLHLKDHTSLISPKTFKMWEQVLPQNTFLRVHRMAIVNLNDIERVSVDNVGSHQIHLAGSDQVINASRRMLPKLKARIEEEFLS